MKKFLSTVAFVCLITGLYAQQHTEIELIRSAYQLEKKSIVSQFMQLTNDEAAKFWPIYEKYEQERVTIGDRRVKLITDYVNERQKSGVQNADEMIKESADIQRKEVNLREKYYKEVKKTVSLKAGLDFFQIEDAIATTIKMKLWEEMPLH